VRLLGRATVATTVRGTGCGSNEKNAESSAFDLGDDSGNKIRSAEYRGVGRRSSSEQVLCYAVLWRSAAWVNRASSGVQRRLRENEQGIDCFILA
jgi:hypothetical protein